MCEYFSSPKWNSSLFLVVSGMFCFCCFFFFPSRYLIRDFYFFWLSTDNCIDIEPGASSPQHLSSASVLIEQTASRSCDPSEGACFQHLFLESLNFRCAPCVHALHSLLGKWPRFLRVNDSSALRALSVSLNGTAGFSRMALPLPYPSLIPPLSLPFQTCIRAYGGG